ncbi:hypothetical protein KY284_033652 [Solanum tuberosum]|nr:hypothetical protein KY284_033652 [Solanum tuberosum]
MIHEIQYMLQSWDFPTISHYITCATAYTCVCNWEQQVFGAAAEDLEINYPSRKLIEKYEERRRRIIYVMSRFIDRKMEHFQNVNMFFLYTQNLSNELNAKVVASMLNNPIMSFVVLKRYLEVKLRI